MCTLQNFSNTYRFAADEITDQELHGFIAQNNTACFSEIYIADNSETISYFPSFDRNKFCGRICAYTGPQEVKAISVSHRNARLGKPSAQFQVNRRVRSPFKSFQLLPGPLFSLIPAFSITL